MHEDTRKTMDAIRAATAGLTEDDLHRREKPDKWSIAQILDHLRKTYASTAYILSRCLEQNTTKGRTPTPWERLSALVVVDFGCYPAGVKSPAFALPSADPGPGVVEATLEALTVFDSTVAQAAERFGLRARLANHPVLGPFNARQWRRFHLVHTRRHTRQIMRLRR